MLSQRLPLLVFLTINIALLSSCLPDGQSTISTIPMTETNKTLPESQISTITPTSVLVTQPTPLSVNDAYASLEELMNNGVDCFLPCWLGITPGRSTLLDLHEKLTMFGGIASEEYEGYPYNGMVLGRMVLPYENDNMVIEIKTNFISFPGDDKISFIGIYNRVYRRENEHYVEDAYGYPAYNDTFSHYTIFGILSTYGLPNNVFIEAHLRGDSPVSPGFGDHFSIHVWYPDKGIFMEYQMPVESSGEDYHFCPTNAFILGGLIPPNISGGYQDFLLRLGDLYKGFFPPTIYVKTPEAAFGITIEEFYQIFSSPTNRCLETPKAIWWP